VRAVDRKQVQPRLDALPRISAHLFYLRERFDERMSSGHDGLHLPFTECIDRPHRNSRIDERRLLVQEIPRRLRIRNYRQDSSYPRHDLTGAHNLLGIQSWQQ
jgi:hypothetical protein